MSNSNKNKEVFLAVDNNTYLLAKDEEGNIYVHRVTISEDTDGNKTIETKSVKL